MKELRAVMRVEAEMRGGTLHGPEYLVHRVEQALRGLKRTGVVCKVELIPLGEPMGGEPVEPVEPVEPEVVSEARPRQLWGESGE